MNILVVYGSRRGGTEEIAQRLGTALRAKGFDVDVMPARSAGDLTRYRAVIVGGALYAGRWFAEAQRFVIRHASDLRNRHVWFFSSGPLDASAEKEEIQPTAEVSQLIGYVGAHDHVTFGGRLAPDAKGFIASSMAKTRAGDWREMAHVEGWAAQIAQLLEDSPPAEPRPSSAFTALPPRGLIASLCLFAGITAVGGGATLLMRPDGSLIGLPLWLLRHTPFDDFSIPGLLLFLVVGCGNMVSGVMHVRRSQNAPMVSAVSGTALVVWMIVQMAMFRSFHPLQDAYLAIGLVITAISVRSIRDQLRAFPRAPTDGQPVLHH